MKLCWEYNYSCQYNKLRHCIGEYKGQTLPLWICVENIIYNIKHGTGECKGQDN